MRGVISGLMMLSLSITPLSITLGQVRAGSGSGTRRTLRGSDAAQLRRLLQQRARSRSSRSTRRPSKTATSRTSAAQSSRKIRKRSAKKQVDPNAQAILQQRIADALQAEMLKINGRMPGEKRQREIVQQQLKRAQAEGLIAGDADLGSADGVSSKQPEGLSGGSLFGDGRGSTRKPIRRGRSQIYRPSRNRMSLPSRSRVNVPTRSSLDRNGRPSRRLRSVAPGGNSGMPLPDLKGSNGAMGSPEQLQRQLQRLLK